MLGGGDEQSETDVQAAFSMNIGSVRMTERHLHTDPPTQQEIDEAVARRKLKAMGVQIDSLSREQAEYLGR